MVAFNRSFWWIMLAGPLLGLALALFYLQSFSPSLLPTILPSPNTDPVSSREETSPILTLDGLRTFLAQERQGIKNILFVTETRLADLREHRQILTHRKQTTADTYLEELKKQRALAHSAVAETLARLQNSETLFKMGGLESAPEVLQSAFIQSIKNDYFALQRREAALSTQLGDRHPDLLAVRAEINTIKSQIEKEISRLLTGMRQEQEVAATKDQELEHTIKSLEETPEESALHAKIKNLEADLASLQQRDRDFWEKEKELAVLIAQNSATKRPDNKARPDNSENVSFIYLFLTLGFLGGLSLSALTVLVSGRKLPAEAESVTQESADIFQPHVRACLPLLRPLSGLSKLPFYSVSKGASFNKVLSSILSPQTVAQKTYKRVVNRVAETLWQSAQGTGSYTVVITSYKRGSGASSLTLSLAACLAKREGKILLIDATSHANSLNAFFGVEINPLQPIVLDRREDLLSIINRDAKTGIFVLPIGLANMSSLTSDQMQRLTKGLKEVSSSFDLVMLDAGCLVEEEAARWFARRGNEVLILAQTRDITSEILEEIEDALGEDSPPFSIIENEWHGALREIFQKKSV